MEGKVMTMSGNISRDEIPSEVAALLALDKLPIERGDASTASLLRLDHRVALVTGGGGDGLGNAICHRLAEQGANLAIVDLKLGSAEETASQIRERWDVEAEAVQANVTNPQEVADAVSQVARRFGSVDIVVNNVGGSGGMNSEGKRLGASGPFHAEPEERIQHVVSVNFLSTLLVTRAALPGMIERGRGRIINIASEAAKMGQPGLATYAASKAGVISFTRNLATEVGPRGVSTVAVCPGVMVSSTAIKTISERVPEHLAGELAMISLGRPSVPDEVASLVAFLASEAGSYIHGAAISIGGGLAD
jgi:3-oxoacyl-[acyl-carrier protein] reductase